MSKERPFEDIIPVPNIKVGYFEKEAYLEIIDRQAKQIDSFAYTKMALQTRIETLEKNQRPQGEWIPVSEREFPDDETEVLIQYGESMMVGYHIFDRTIYPSEFKDENETGWYDSKDNFICGSDEVIAWMPLPEAYKETDNE